MPRKVHTEARLAALRRIGILVTFLLLLVASLLPAMVSAQSQVFEENFDGRTLSSDSWDTDNTPNSGIWRVKGGDLDISDFPTSLDDISSDGIDLFWCNKEFCGDWTAEARFHGFGIATEQETVPGSEMYVPGGYYQEMNEEGETVSRYYEDIIIPESQVEGTAELKLSMIPTELGSRRSIGDALHMGILMATDEAWRVRIGTFWGEAKYTYYDLPRGTDDVTFKIRKEGHTYTFFMNGKQIHQEEVSINYGMHRRPAIWLGVDSNYVRAWGKVAYIKVVGDPCDGTGIGGGPTGGTGGGGDDRGEDGPTDEQAAAAAAAAAGLAALWAIANGLGPNISSDLSNFINRLRGEGGGKTNGRLPVDAGGPPQKPESPDYDADSGTLPGKPEQEAIAEQQAKSTGIESQIDVIVDEFNAATEKRGALSKKLDELEERLQYEKDEYNAALKDAEKDYSTAYDNIASNYSEGYAKVMSDIITESVNTGDTELISKAKEKELGNIRANLRSYEDKLKHWEKELEHSSHSTEEIKQLREVNPDWKSVLTPEEIKESIKFCEEKIELYESLQDGFDSALNELLTHSNHVRGIIDQYDKSIDRIEQQTSEVKEDYEAESAKQEAARNAHSELRAIQYDKVVPQDLGSYDGYEDDVNFLKNQRQDYHKQVNDLNSYLKHHRPGEPGYDPNQISTMRTNIKLAEDAIKRAEQNIRKQGGHVPPDKGLECDYDPYGGVGKDVAQDWRDIKDNMRLQDELTRKVENFIRNNPQYGRLRDNIYNEDGSVNKDTLDKMMGHYMRELEHADELSAETLESVGYWLSKGYFDTAREIFTGANADGETSYSAIGLRGLIGMMTGGASEFAYTPIDATYRMKDGVDRGEEGITVAGKAVGGVLLDAFMDLMGDNILEAGADALKKTEVGKIVFEYLDELSKKLNKPLGGSKGPASLTDDLARKKAAMKAALESGDDDAILALYKNGGMDDLGGLERGGHITTEEANKLNKVITKHANKSVDKATKTSIEGFQRENNVKVKEGLVADNGSSARSGGPRSVKTDADRTVVVTFDDDSLNRYAHRNNISVKEAHDKLSGKFAETHQDHLDWHLQDNMGYDVKVTGNGTRDFDAKVYDRIGPGAGQSDSYPERYTNLSQDQGSTEVYKVDDLGNCQDPYKASGAATVDQNQLNKQKYEEGMTENPRQLTQKDSEILLEQQKKAINKPNVSGKDAAKVAERTGKAASLNGDTEIANSNVVKTGQELRKNPQDMSGILEKNGYSSEQEYIGATKNQINSYNPTYAEWKGGRFNGGLRCA